MTRRGADPSEAGLEQSIARLLTIGTYLAIALLVVGFALMLASGTGPLSGAPRFDLATVSGDLLALRPTGFIGVGLIVVVATPASRVLASLIGYGRSGERRMALVAISILIVILLSVVTAIVLEG
jgi:uncharacterized membrane protein